MNIFNRLWQKLTRHETTTSETTYWPGQFASKAERTEQNSLTLLAFIIIATISILALIRTQNNPPPDPPVYQAHILVEPASPVVNERVQVRAIVPVAVDSYYWEIIDDEGNTENTYTDPVWSETYETSRNLTVELQTRRNDVVIASTKRELLIQNADSQTATITLTRQDNTAETISQTEPTGLRVEISGIDETRRIQITAGHGGFAPSAAECSNPQSSLERNLTDSNPADIWYCPPADQQVHDVNIEVRLLPPMEQATLQLTFSTPTLTLETTPVENPGDVNCLPEPLRYVQQLEFSPADENRQILQLATENIAAIQITFADDSNSCSQLTIQNPDEDILNYEVNLNRTYWLFIAPSDPTLPARVSLTLPEPARYQVQDESVIDFQNLAIDATLRVAVGFKRTLDGADTGSLQPADTVRITGYVPGNDGTPRCLRVRILNTSSGIITNDETGWMTPGGETDYLEGNPDIQSLPRLQEPACT